MLVICDSALSYVILPVAGTGLRGYRLLQPNSEIRATFLPQLIWGTTGVRRLIGFGASLIETCRSTADGWLTNRRKPSRAGMQTQWEP